MLKPAANMQLLAILCLCVSSLLALPHDRKIAPRIIGGTPASDAQFPFAVAIDSEGSSSTHFCGGTLLSNKYILTSATCLLDGTTFRITLGSNRLNTSDVNRVVTSTTITHTHPDYNPATLENDIALLELPLVVLLTNYIQAASLPTEEVSDDATTTAIGWGQTSDDDTELSEVLNYIEVTVLSNTDCQAIYGSIINDNMVCVSGDANEGSCLGDSGSPLLETDSVVGINSFYSGNGCETTDPSGYTRVFPYLTWINSIIQ